MKKVNEVYIKVPPSIVAAHNKLYDLCEENPININVEKAAEFLGMDVEGLRSSVDQGRCPFGLGVQKKLHGNRAFKISTYVFYNWATGGAIFRTLKIERLKEQKTRKYKARRTN